MELEPACRVALSNGDLVFVFFFCFFFFVCWRLLLMAMDGSAQQMDNCWGAKRWPT